MADINTIVGTKIYIGTEGFVPSPDNDASAYELDTYVEIIGVITIPEYGDSANEVEQLWVADSRVRKAKGARNAGGGDLVCSNLDSDAGQVRCREAIDSNLPYPIKIVKSNKVTALGSGGVDYMRALVMSDRSAAGGADDPDNITFALAVTTAITRVAAT